MRHVIPAAIAAGAILAGALPGTAHAGPTVPVTVTQESLDTCADPFVSPLLLSHGDKRSYFVAPGGDFESGTDGWQLDGGAAIVDGSNQIDAIGGQHSLHLPPGGSAISPAFCVDERFPSFRMATGQFGDKAKADVDVQVVYPGVEDNVRGVGRFDPKAGKDWSLTKDMKLNNKPFGWRRIALRFEVSKGQEGSDLRIDDVVVDPRMRG